MLILLLLLLLDRRKQLMSLNPNHLLGSFEESLLNGRMNPAGMVDGFYAVIGASGSFFPEHITLPVNAGFYQVSEDIAASPYLGIINLASLGKRGYKVPSKGTIQCVSVYFFCLKICIICEHN